ncbi:hypothetical protein F5B19DRAFT_475396 [Rostrohypoxylon terebratum]|nr:hypothetical protein F5B19DRAFT_475396 [Rostrohypoxylon terebratum]
MINFPLLLLGLHFLSDGIFLLLFPSLLLLSRGLLGVAVRTCLVNDGMDRSSCLGESTARYTNGMVRSVTEHTEFRPGAVLDRRLGMPRTCRSPASFVVFYSTLAHLDSF